MTYLIDTNVVSEIAKRRRNPGVLDWLAATRQTGHHISVLSLGELGRGIEAVRRRGDERQVESLQRALWTVRKDFDDRIIPITLDVAEIWARLPVTTPTVDALIGATALAHGWTVVTRNTRDFAPIGVSVLNPFTEQEAR